MSPITVAIAGGTGNIGTHATQAFLDPKVFPSLVSRVIIFTRSTTSDKVKELLPLGADVRQISESSTVSPEDLKHVDVYVNCLSHLIPYSVHDQNAKTAAEAGVKVYIPSEFGSDHKTNPFEHAMWSSKANHAAYAKRVGGGKMKVISIYTGHFMEDGIGPWFGFDTHGKIYTSVGSSSTRYSLTSKGDIGRAVVRVSILATSNPSVIPDELRIFGDSKSYAEIAEIMGKESGETIKVVELDYDDFKASLESNGDPLSWIRLVTGSGRFDFSDRHHRELVNPAETEWKWKTLEEYAEEVGGKPFA